MAISPTFGDEIRVGYARWIRHTDRRGIKLGQCAVENSNVKVVYSCKTHPKPSRDIVPGYSMCQSKRQLNTCQ